MGLDIGPETAERFAAVVRECKTIVWNGPMGVFEIPPFHNGSLELLKAITEVTEAGQAISIVGGGETASFASGQPEYAGKLSHISTGGGASLELLEGKQLPGVVALSERT